MAYNFIASSSGYISTSSSPATSSPMTLACWARPTSLAATRCCLSIGSTVNSYQNRVQLVITTTGAVRATSVVSGFTQGQADSTNTLTVNTWNHSAAVFTSQSSRRAYLNGTAGNINTQSQGDHASFNYIIIGARYDTNVLGNYFQGDLAEIGIWNVALTDAEISSLSKGMACDKVRPQSLVFYAPLVRNLLDRERGLALTNNNGATVSDHPRIYL